MAPSEVFSDPIAGLDYKQLEKFKLKEKYDKINTGKYEPADDDATEWDLNDLSKTLLKIGGFPAISATFWSFLATISMYNKFEEDSVT